MSWKSIWKWSSLTFYIIYGLSVISVVIFIAFMIWLAIGSDEAVNNTVFINRMGLTVAFISLPGTLVTLLSSFDMNKKKKFKATTVCPKCQHNVVINLTEE
jgi:uncharacterized membrane protein